MNFSMIFDAFLLPVKFVASARNSLSSQDEDCIDELSNQSRIKNWTNCRPSITTDETNSQSTDPQALVMNQSRHFLTRRRSRNWAKSQSCQRQLLRQSQMIRINLVNWQSHLLTTTISSYHYPWMMRRVSTDDLTPLPYMTFRPYHTSMHERPYRFMTQNINVELVLRIPYGN